MNNSINLTVQPTQPGPPKIPPYLYRSHSTITVQVIAFAILGIIIILGNLASIITFIKTQSLRKRSNYMLINLSVADFMIAIVVFISCNYFSVIHNINRRSLELSLEILDAFTGTSSLICLMLIGVERFHAIVFPFRHRMLGLKHYLVWCILPWLFAVMFGVSAAVIDSKNPSHVDIYTLVRFTFLIVVLLVMIASYVAIWLKSRKANPSAQNQNLRERDKKLSVTLFIVTFASMLTWLPIQCFGYILYFSRPLALPHYNYFITLKLIQYCNSAINFAIYILRMRNFKAGFVALFGCKKRTNHKPETTNAFYISRTESVPEVTSISTISLNLISQGSYSLKDEAQSTKMEGKHSIDRNCFGQFVETIERN